MSRYGIMLPISSNGHHSDIEILSSIDNDRIDSIWVRDLPIAEYRDKDEGSCLDPFLFLNELSSIFCNKFILGLAVINTSFRNPENTIREILSMLELKEKSKFIFGVGEGEKKEVFELLGIDYDNKKLLFEKWLKRYEAYYQNQVSGLSSIENKTYMKWLKDIKIPKLTVSTRNIDLLQKYKDIIERNIIWYSQPNTISEIKKGFPDIELNMFLRINLVSKDNTLKFDDKGGIIVVSPDKLRKLSEEYLTLGVDRLLLSLENQSASSSLLNRI
ncbi:hypothetical protein SAMN02910293_00349 [Streptococcus henryi]|uniref:Luciferase-like monooxygenase n=1 Tax=Streptococcus henryi TaxID=439219 RepID=A0A1G6AFE4_9STRE|nr:hypothetical protein [Streptococcus henryi]SDB07127.1 hypothetical protein SAMN02910293_00349 [Streptococcus henryi]